MKNKGKEEAAAIGEPSPPFEVLFRLLCMGCKSTFAKGVKVNAIKECVGHTRKIWNYNFECPCCGCKIVMGRASGDLEYEVKKGAGRRVKKEM